MLKCLENEKCNAHARKFEVKVRNTSMETCDGERRVGFEVSNGLSVRERYLKDSVSGLCCSGSDNSTLVVTEREHGECTDVACRTVCVAGTRGGMLILRFSWEADRAW